jgi:glycosyltransferase involved in cell wall biosynthesis
VKVLFLNRPDAYTSWGGDTTQMVKTKESLELLGVKVEVSLNQQVDISGYDLVHIFNIQSPQIGLSYVQAAKKAGKCIIVSTIFWDMRHVFPRVPKGRLLRSRSELKKLYVQLRRIWTPSPPKNKIDRPEVQILKAADALIPNSSAEIEHLALLFDLPEIRMKSWVVPNAAEVGEAPKGPDPEPLRKLPREFVLEAARIELIKGQSLLLKGLMDRPEIPIVLVGAQHGEYSSEVSALASKRGNTWVIGRVPQEEMTYYYKRARVHALPSLRESPGLSTLEAALHGANCVVSYHSPVAEYFMGNAWICDPFSAESIGNAVLEAWIAERSGSLGRVVQTNFSYKEVAKKTLRVYESALSRFGGVAGSGIIN